MAASGPPATSWKEIQREFWLALVGVVSVLFAILVVLFPGDGAVAIVWGHRRVRGTVRGPPDLPRFRLRRLHQEMERLAGSA